MDVFIAGGIFLLAYALIASERFDRTLIALLGGLLVVVLGVVDLRLVRQLIGDGSVPLGARAALVGLLAWLINPIDLIPEFIPVLGPLHDVVVAVLVLRYVRRRLGDEELRRRWPGTPEGYGLLSGVLGMSRSR